MVELLLTLLRDLLYTIYLRIRYKDPEIRETLWRDFQDPNKLHPTFWIIPGIIGGVLILMFVGLMVSAIIAELRNL